MSFLEFIKKLLRIFFKFYLNQDITLRSWQTSLKSEENKYWKSQSSFFYFDGMEFLFLITSLPRRASLPRSSNVSS